MAPLALVELGPHHRLWRAAVTNASGAKCGAGGGRQLVEIASGMNYWDGQQWVPSDPAFDAVEDGFVANRLQHKVWLGANLNVPGAVTLTGPDGITLRSTPVALGLYDAASGRAVFIARVSDCAGMLVGSNRVLYQSAFGRLADVEYVIDRASFEQDVVLKPGLNAADYGFDPATARLQVFTEFYGAPEPERITRPIRVEKELAVRQRRVSPDLVDEVLGFGEMVFATGRAFPVGASASSSSPAAPVAKEFKSTAGRTFLIESVEVASVSGEIETAQASGLVIDYLLSISSTLTGARVFQGDTTYFVRGPVVCSGPVTIEGGAVFKFPNSTGTTPTPTNACIKINNSVTCKTSSYRPAIFTAGDDDGIGETLCGATDPVTGLPVWAGYGGESQLASGLRYANPALWLYYLSSPTLSDVRFCYAQEAVRVEGGSGFSATIAHAQLRQCLRGIVVTGSGSSSGSGVQLTVNNSLMAKLQTSVTVNTASVSASLYHSTVEGSTYLVTSSRSPSLYFVNSILANVANNVSGSASLSGNYNAFWSANPFGSNQQTDPDPTSPFAPTTWTDEHNDVWPLITTGQGAYYLRDGSPLRDLGLGSIGTSLKNELAKRTTFPPTFFSDDVTSSQTLGPQPIRDTDTLDLGYHYPAVDYALAGATVNNATLAIDQGTVLAALSPDWGPIAYPDWGIRFNPGARLVVNGVPTNRVVFAHLEAVQENPWFLVDQYGFWYTGQLTGPWITWKGLVFEGCPATPMVEVICRYADFPTLSSWAWNVHLGHSVPEMASDLVSNVQLDGCLFQGGVLLYESGGPAGRTVTFRNNIFERADVILSNYADYNNWTVAEQLTAVNNLFYYDVLAFYPVSTNWTFTDNIFDHAAFGLDYYGNPYNGPVVNNHNAYVAMTDRLAPAAPTSTDPDLASLTYPSGSLGRLYLPTSATLLIDKGSRLASEAGLFHFTSFTSNAKEGNDQNQTSTQVNIGPHYLALTSGKPFDYDQDDIPDYVEDYNEDGQPQTDESNWRSPNSGPIQILGLANGQTLSGTVEIRFGVTDPGSRLRSVDLLVDGEAADWCPPATPPFSAVFSLEVDTTRIQNGPVSLSLQAMFDDTVRWDSGDACSATDSDYMSRTELSSSVAATIANPVGFASWEEWGGETAALLEAHTAAPSVAYALHLYGSDYPYARGVAEGAYFEGTAVNGTINAMLQVSQGGPLRPDQNPVVFGVLELFGSSGNSALVTPIIRQSVPWMDLGLWSVAYQDCMLYVHDLILNKKTAELGDPTDASGYHYLRDLKLNGWAGTAGLCGDPPVAVPPPQPGQPNEGQTWPMRRCPAKRSDIRQDQDKLLAILGDPRVRNLYIYAHGEPFKMAGIADHRIRKATGHRYRFVYLDCCSSAVKPGLLGAFGMRKDEFKTATDLPFYRSRGDVHPGAYLGYTHHPNYCFKRDWTGPDGTQYQYYFAKGLGVYHDELQFYWSLLGYTIYDANQEATDHARDALINEYFDDLAHPEYNPGKILRINGYKDLKFNQFNNKYEWPPP